MHKISENIAKWSLDESQLDKDDLEALSIVNFPKKLGYRQCIQKRIKRLRGAGGFVDKQIYDINDIKYLVTNKDIAKAEVLRFSPSGSTSREIEQSKKFLDGIMKAKAYQVTYIDANFAEEELHEFLSKFSTPKPTPSMKVKQVLGEVKTAKKPVKKKGLTDKQKAIAKEKFESGEADVKELAAELKVTQTLLKEYLKTL